MGIGRGYDWTSDGRVSDGHRMEIFSGFFLFFYFFIFFIFFLILCTILITTDGPATVPLLDRQVATHIVLQWLQQQLLLIL